MVGHLHVLVKNVPITEHGLSIGEIKLEDRMNYKIVEKLIQPRVAHALKEHVLQSEGTVLFLKLLRYTVLAFTDKELIVLQRVRRIWYSIFFLRYWRTWLIENDLRVDEFYVTRNALFCIELNGHELLQNIRFCRDNECPHAFLPTLFHSQWNENFFRKMRSMSSTFSTVVNFSVRDFMHRIKRAEFLVDSESVLEKFTDKGLTKQRDMYVPKTMPSDIEISQVINVARKEAISDLASVGIKCAPTSSCSILPSELFAAPQFSTESTETGDDADDDDIVEIKELFPNFHQDLDLKDCTNEFSKYSIIKFTMYFFNQSL